MQGLQQGRKKTVHRPARGPVNVDMHEVACGGSHVQPLPEECHLVAHAAAAHMRHAHAGLDSLREGQCAEVVAVGVHHQPDDLTIVRIHRVGRAP